jgi:hypothetical protein
MAAQANFSTPGSVAEDEFDDDFTVLFGARADS